jgi:hypothetical protein
MFRKILFLSILTATLGYGGTETRFADTSITPVENPLNPRVSFTYNGEKSTKAAFAWSALGTVAPVVLGLSATSLSDDATLPLILVLGGLAVGPSLGEFYAGSPNRGVVGPVSAPAVSANMPWKRAGSGKPALGSASRIDRNPIYFELSGPVLITRLRSQTLDNPLVWGGIAGEKEADALR